MRIYPRLYPRSNGYMETVRLLADLRKSQINARQIIVNNVMVSDDCSFCKRRKAGQVKYIQQISEIFDNLNRAEVPVFAEEIKGKEALERLKRNLFEVKQGTG